MVLVNVKNILDEKGNWVSSKAKDNQNEFFNFLYPNNNQTIWIHGLGSIIFTDLNKMKEKISKDIDSIFAEEFLKTKNKYTESYLAKQYIKYQKAKDKIMLLTEEEINKYECNF
jgi:hypothetical protein